MREEVQRKMILWTFGLVAALGAACVFTLLTPPAFLPADSRGRQSNELPRNAPKSISVISGQRQPAAAVPAHSVVSLDANDAFQAVDLSLSCKGPQYASFTSGVTQVRLSGVLCLNDGVPVGGQRSVQDIESSDIRNLSNGYSATVFHLERGGFTTDYISLKPGANRIRVAHTLKDGQTESREYIIKRDPPAAP